ncbi:SLAP domain-containing protein [Psychrobacillus sp. NPDC096426]|uniref:SLAP domain-containing protein n=1 Tax=Psychrobacillus sp. NPDC096426 TaxID=3364491 RepID=UPI0037F30BFF
MVKRFKGNQAKPTNRLKTMLEFSDKWDLDQQDRYVFQYFHNKLKGLEPNQVNIHGVELLKAEDGFIMTAIIRHSLQKALNIQDIRLVVRDTEGKELARKDFNMEYFGVLNSLRARAWVFDFDKDSLLVSEDEIQDKMEFEVVFEIQEPAVSRFELQLDDNWSNGLTEEQRSSLSTTLSSLDSIKQDEISVSAFNLEVVEDGVSVYVFVRNSFNNDITISNLPLQLFDAAGDLIAQLGFPLEQFTVQPTHARPISLHFPETVFKKAAPDWTSWTIKLTSQG